MQNKTLGILMIILLLFSACKDEETPLSSTKQLISYSIQKSDTLGQQMEAHPCAGVYAITADMDFEH